MEASIHSYEQRSISEQGFELDNKRNRVIVVDGVNPDVRWPELSGSRAPRAARRAGNSYLKLRNFHLWSGRLDGEAGPAAAAAAASPERSAQSGPRRKLPGLAGRRSRRRDQRRRYSLPALHYDEGPFASNEWLTSKYTLLNFLPKNLFQQFRRLANFYFLVTALLQFLIPLSPVGPATSLLPLLFVVCTSAIKQAYEDYLRHQLDNQLNGRLFHVRRRGRLVRARAKDIRAGDFVFVRNNEEIPCDMVLLAASGPADRCYVTTANLDGETSLKGRSCFQIREKLGPIEQLDEAMLVLEFEPPNATLYEFNATLWSPRDRHAYRALTDGLLGGPPAPAQAAAQPEVEEEQDDNDDDDDDDDDETGSHANLSAIQHLMLRLRERSSRASSGSRRSQSAAGSSKRAGAEQLSPAAAGFRRALDSALRRGAAAAPLEHHEIGLDVSNLLLRASRLKNTAHVYGMAVYTGKDTKLAHNSQVKANKFSSLESKVNLYLIIAFILLTALSFVCAILHERQSERDSFQKIFMAYFLLYNYLVPISLYVTLEFVKFFGTMAVVEDKKMRYPMWQSLNKSWSNAEPAATGQPAEAGGGAASSGKRVRVVEGPRCNSSDLNEELGQVQVLFSDKTGTLTENRMRFTACSLDSQLYRQLDAGLYRQPARLFREPIANVLERLRRVASGRHTVLAAAAAAAASSAGQQPAAEAPRPRDGEKPFDHRRVPPLDQLSQVEELESEERVVEFFMCLCLCSTVALNERLPLGECLPDAVGADGYDFQSASPDEESLISAAHQLGVSLCKSSDQECYIAVRRSRAHAPPPAADRKSAAAKPAGASFNALLETRNSNDKFIVRHFERLVVFEFNSNRKRMSVIYRDCDGDCIIMVSKGSESLLDCVQLNGLQESQRLCFNATLAHFEAFAMSGLRTLLVARRPLSALDFEQIQAEMRRARLSVDNREELMALLYQRAESGLALIGATAVEDTLQEGVPETIADLRAAGIKVWLLTGDKVETAISVAYLCRLLEPGMSLLYLVRQQDAHACQRLLGSIERRLKAAARSADEPAVGAGAASASSYSQQLLEESLRDRKRQLSPEVHRFALIADGRSLYYAMKYAKRELAQVCGACTCVLGCRLSPLQKAEVVAMIKQSDEQPITAAIGDGANDVSMIQEAHVGIGVTGKDGRQAVNSSDFAISRFHMLSRLLFVHGQLFYHRTANTVLYFFYKNLLFVLPQFLYSLYNLKLVVSLYNPIQLMSFNLFFTSLPILLYGLYEKHLPEETLESQPALYRSNQGNRALRLSAFFVWLALAGAEGCLTYYLAVYNWPAAPFLRQQQQQPAPAGRINGLSVVIYFAVVLVATLKLYFLSRYHTFVFNLSALVSCLALPAVLYVYSLFDWSFVFRDNSFYGTFLVYLEAPLFWLLVVVITLAAIVPTWLWSLQDRLKSAREIRQAASEPAAAH